MDDQKDPKIKFLREHGSLNWRPQKVTDEIFAGNEFFDSCDIVQVKYEMLRRVRVEGLSVTQAASAFGFSRVAFYQIQKAYEEGGLPALIPRRRGPKHAHKLTDTILSFIDRCRAKDKTLRAPALATMLREQFGFSVHSRSIERALVRRGKKGQ
jgi:transposase